MSMNQPISVREQRLRKQGIRIRWQASTRDYLIINHDCQYDRLNLGCAVGRAEDMLQAVTRAEIYIKERRKRSVQKVYTQAKDLTLNEFLRQIAMIIGSLSNTQAKIYSGIYERERHQQ